MIFSSMEEAKEVAVTIFDRKDFEDLTSDQMNCIKGMYLCLDVLDEFEARHCDEEGGKLEEIVDEISCKAISTASEDIVAAISELVVYFRDQNASYY